MLEDKERMELLMLRQRVETQREEIKKLSEQLERNKAYTKKIERQLAELIIELEAAVNYRKIELQVIRETS